MSVQPLTTAALNIEQAGTCDRCHKADGRGLANVRGLMLCGLCHLIAVARFRLSS